MTGTTRTLARYLAELKFEDLPAEVIEGALRAVTDSLGNLVGGSALDARLPFMRLAQSMGEGKPSASLLRDNAKVGIAAAAMGNCAQVTEMDFCDGAHSENGHLYIWPGAVTVPAAFAAAEASGISGAAFLASVVAGYEGATRIVHSMDIDSTEPATIQGGGVAVFGASGAAAHAMGLTPDEMTSAFGMSGIFCPVPSGYRFYGDEGLKPRADITHGWAWMSMTGVFAAQSAKQGLEMLQEQNILDGNLGLWRMLGMNTFDEASITAGLGQDFNIPNYAAKRYPGCAFTHASIIGANALASEHDLDVTAIERIDVVTNKREAIGFEDQDPGSLVDRMFSIPAQVSTSLISGEPGPNWYDRRAAESKQRIALAKRVFVSYDNECEAARAAGKRLSKIAIQMRDGRRLEAKVDDEPQVKTREQIENKFLTTASQVVGREQAERILGEIRNLPEAGSLDMLIREINA